MTQKETKMTMREYKKTGETISLLGFGAMRLPLQKGSDKEIDFQKAKEMVDYAYAHGVNYFDTAYIYHHGMSESFLGKALSSYPRESYNLATKMPLFILETEDDVERIFQEQLDKCGVEYFDYYLLHNISRHTFAKTKQLNVYEKLLQKKREGKIRHLGFSFHDTPDLLHEVVNEYQWDFAQIQLNYMDWEEQKANLQYQILVDKNIPVIVMEPIRGGMLVSLCDRSLEILKESNPEASAASWALRFAAELSGVLTVLSGMSEPWQVEDNVHTMENFQPLTPQEHKTLNDTLAAYRASGSIPCTACAYCMPCPVGVDIPRVFGVYNRYATGYKGMNSSWAIENVFMSEYNVLGKDKQASNCISCGVCLDKCPQMLQIPTLMKEVEATHQKVKQILKG